MKWILNFLSANRPGRMLVSNGSIHPEIFGKLHNRYLDPTTNTIIIRSDPAVSMTFLTFFTVGSALSLRKCHRNLFARDSSIKQVLHRAFAICMELLQSPSMLEAHSSKCRVTQAQKSSRLVFPLLLIIRRNHDRWF